MDEKDHAAAVLVPLRTALGRMQHLDRDGAGGQAIPSLDDADRDALAPDRLQSMADRDVVLVGEGRRTGDFSDRESLQKRRESVEVIEVRVGQEYLVETADTTAPEKRRDLPAGDVRAADGARVV